MGSLEGLSDLAGESDGDASAGPELADLARETGARFALLLREQEEIGRAGELDEITWSSLKALAGDGAGPGPARLYLLESGADQEPCLLYVCNAGPLQLSLLVPDDFPVRDLRLACERFLKD